MRPPISNNVLTLRLAPPKCFAIGIGLVFRDIKWSRRKAVVKGILEILALLFIGRLALTRG